MQLLPSEVVAAILLAVAQHQIVRLSSLKARMDGHAAQSDLAWRMVIMPSVNSLLLLFERP